jgi:hypothetical protein
MQSKRSKPLAFQTDNVYWADFRPTINRRLNSAAVVLDLYPIRRSNIADQYGAPRTTLEKFADVYLQLTRFPTGKRLRE